MFLQAIANTANRVPPSNDSGVLKNNQKNGASNQSAHRKIPENLKLNSGIVADVTSSTTSQTTSKSTGPYIAISDCISGNPLIDRDNPTTPLNSLDPKFYDTPRSHFNIGLNLTNEQPYSPKRNNIQTVIFVLDFFLICVKIVNIKKLDCISATITITTKWKIQSN